MFEFRPVEFHSPSRLHVGLPSGPFCTLATVPVLSAVVGVVVAVGVVGLVGLVLESEMM